MQMHIVLTSDHIIMVIHGKLPDKALKHCVLTVSFPSYEKQKQIGFLINIST